jgi:hypothetical protein
MLTPEIRDAIMKGLAVGMGLAYAAKALGLKPDTVERWHLRGQGKLKDRPPTPEYVAFSNAVFAAKGEIAFTILPHLVEVAKVNGPFGMAFLDRTAPGWDGKEAALPDEDDEEEHLRLSSAVLALPSEETPITMRERELLIPPAQWKAFKQLMSSGKVQDDDGRDRLSGFRETAGDD